MGVVDEESYRRKNDEFYSQYKAGTLDIGAFLRFALARWLPIRATAWINGVCASCTR
jgi:hypothetical protein